MESREVRALLDVFSVLGVLSIVLQVMRGIPHSVLRIVRSIFAAVLRVMCGILDSVLRIVRSIFDLPFIARRGSLQTGAMLID